MIKKLIALLFFGMAQAALASELVDQKVVELHITQKPEEVEVFQMKKRNPIVLMARHTTCSGAFINDSGDIITAKHCVENMDYMDVITSDQREYRAVLVATSTAHDLAMVHIDRSGTSFFELADTVTRGQRIFVLGSPLAISATLATGIVAKVGGDEILVDCSVLPGNSGGPAFNDDGKLVGVTTAGFIVLFGTTHLNITQGIDAVRFFIKEAIAKRERANK